MTVSRKLRVCPRHCSRLRTAPGRQPAVEPHEHPECDILCCAGHFNESSACASSQHATSSRLSRLSAVPAPMDVNGTANGTNGMHGNGDFSPHLQTDPSKGAQSRQLPACYEASLWHTSACRACARHCDTVRTAASCSSTECGTVCNEHVCRIFAL